MAIPTTNKNSPFLVIAAAFFLGNGAGIRLPVNPPVGRTARDAAVHRSVQAAMLFITRGGSGFAFNGRAALLRRLTRRDRVGSRRNSCRLHAGRFDLDTLAFDLQVTVRVQQKRPGAPHFHMRLSFFVDQVNIVFPAHQEDILVLALNLRFQDYAVMS